MYYKTPCVLKFNLDFGADGRVSANPTVLYALVDSNGKGNDGISIICEGALPEECGHNVGEGLKHDVYIQDLLMFDGKVSSPRFVRTGEIPLHLDYHPTPALHKPIVFNELSPDEQARFTESLEQMVGQKLADPAELRHTG